MAPNNQIHRNIHKYQNLTMSNTTKKNILLPNVGPKTSNIVISLDHKYDSFIFTGTIFGVIFLLIILFLIFLYYYKQRKKIKIKKIENISNQIIIQNPSPVSPRAFQSLQNSSNVNDANTPASSSLSEIKAVNNPDNQKLNEEVNDVINNSGSSSSGRRRREKRKSGNSDGLIKVSTDDLDSNDKKEIQDEIKQYVLDEHNK